MLKLVVKNKRITFSSIILWIISCIISSLWQPTSHIIDGLGVTDRTSEVVTVQNLVQ